MTLSEDILHFIWKYRLFTTQDLRTQSGKQIRVLHMGTHNHDAGPDFLAARVVIDGVDWGGNVEIHVRASDWDRHRHHQDEAYNNVILHVVYEDDKDAYREDGTQPETLELKPRISATILPRYRELMSGMWWIPCEKMIHRVPQFHLSQWLSRLLMERFEHKISTIYTLLDQQRGSWEDTCYIWMARSFGFKVNADAFEQLARSLPLSVIGKHKNNPLAVEALFFGQAGMLENQKFEDAYPQALQREYAHLRQLHSLRPMGGAPWRFMRTRPGNFPTVRIAQFAALCLRSTQLFSIITNIKDIGFLKTFFDDLPVSLYWLKHYRFDSPSSPGGNQLGERSVDILLINAVAGIIFAYGKYIGKETYLYRAVALLEALKVEDNAVLRRFSAIGVKVAQAAESQALLQMKTFYCDKKKCLDCGVGLQLIKHGE
ncbi:DUF2851 family protein [Parapedobacter sp. 10938]|uniref:DUF2851 family protein n=1 Tax=Parapedobacter flavus TaxID=3110225 RepID=UPI002DB571F3|nr:DUF2851 family protein [Parapedobacter sp. 10938]MEC3881723.1 DUF2851 family protein [Parapedobacter sp. 10938]